MALASVVALAAAPDRAEAQSLAAPIAIAVVKPEELVRQNVTRAEDLSRVVPALVATAGGGPNTSFYVRGVGNSTNNSYSDPAIAFNYDGVYIGRPNSTQGFFYDLQRIEVLKGPQGTLYGRNATGGAINVLPNRPEIGVNSAEFQASYGNYDAVQAQGAVNLAIGESGAFRLSGAVNRHDGYLYDGTSDQDEVAVRAQLLAELTPDLTTRVGADYSHQGGAGTGSFTYGTFALVNGVFVFTPTPQLGPKVGVHDPRTEAFVQTRFIAQVGRRSEAVGGYPDQNNAVWGVTSETNWTSALGTLAVQAAYRESDINSLSTTSDFRAFYTARGIPVGTNGVQPPPVLNTPRPQHPDPDQHDAGDQEDHLPRRRRLAADAAEPAVRQLRDGFSQRRVQLRARSRDLRSRDDQGLYDRVQEPVLRQSAAAQRRGVLLEVQGPADRAVRHRLLDPADLGVLHRQHRPQHDQGGRRRPAADADDADRRQRPVSRQRVRQLHHLHRAGRGHPQLHLPVDPGRSSAAHARAVPGRLLGQARAVQPQMVVQRQRRADDQARRVQAGRPGRHPLARRLLRRHQLPALGRLARGVPVGRLAHPRDSDTWFATVFVSNIENERRITQSNVNTSIGAQSAVATAPRTYGLRLGARFR